MKISFNARSFFWPLARPENFNSLNRRMNLVTGFDKPSLLFSQFFLKYEPLLRAMSIKSKYQSKARGGCRAFIERPHCLPGTVIDVVDLRLFGCCCNQGPQV
jgi:hypothetical protein